MYGDTISLKCLSTTSKFCLLNNNKKIITNNEVYLINKSVKSRK